MKRLVAVLIVVGSLGSLAQTPRRETKRTEKIEKIDKAKEEPTPTTLIRPARLDFEGSNLTGQRNTAGGVYLYARKELRVRSMINKPDNFRTEINETIDPR